MEKAQPSTPQLNLRLAALSDLDALQELIPLSARVLSRGYYTPAQTASAIRYVFGVDTRLIQDGTYFLVESDHEPVGCGGWSRRKALYGGDQMKAEVDPLLDPNSDAARIRAFFVHPNWARRGVASIILHACLQAARQAGFSHAELMATLPGVPFYANAGFQLIDRLPTRLPDGMVIEFIKMSRAL